MFGASTGEISPKHGGADSVREGFDVCRRLGREARVRHGVVGPRSSALSERRTLARIYGWALFVRVVVGLLAYGLTLYADLPIVEDARFYEEMGYTVAQDWLSGREVDFDSLPQGVQTAQLLVATIAVFYYVTGGVRALPLLLVGYSVVTALVPIYVYRVAGELHAADAVARRAAWLVALSPAFVFWSGSLYKEGLTLLFLSIAAYHTLRLQSRGRARSLITIVLCIVALWGVRFYLAIVLTLAVALGLFWGRVSHGRPSAGVSGFVRQAVVLAVFVAVIIAVGTTVRADHVLFESDEGVLVNLDVRRAGSAREAGSGYLQEAQIATRDEALQYLPIGLFYFLTVPFPWQVGSYRQNLIIPENAFWLTLYPLIGLGVSRALRLNRRGTVFLVLLTGGMCVVYALLSANVGTTYRMRSQVWLLWAPFAAWGWEVWREHWRPARRRGLGRGDSRAAMVRSLQ